VTVLNLPQDHRGNERLGFAVEDEPGAVVGRAFERRSRTPAAPAHTTRPPTTTAAVAAGAWI
jgi:hypothetical protein